MELGLAVAGAFSLPKLFGKKAGEREAVRRDAPASPLKSVRICRAEGTVERKAV